MSIRVIPSSILLRFLATEVESFPFLESFAREYSQKVSEDKKTPLFSKTTKYNSFPIRCQWKSDKSERKRKKYDKGNQSGSTMNQNTNRTFSGDVSDIHQNETHWRQEKEMISLTKIKKTNDLTSSIIKVLNKITDENFDIQINDLLHVLKESKDPSAVKIVSSIILEKVWYDKSFYKLYVSLCKKLWENNEWLDEAYSIFKCGSDHSPQFFYCIKIEPSENPTQHLIGPFKTQEDAEKMATKNVHLRTIFLALCRDHFLNREVYIQQSSHLPDNNERYKLRRKLFGTVEIMGQFYEMGYLCEEVIHFLFLSLLHTDNHHHGAKYEEEIEAFHLLWSLIKDKMPYGTFREYRPLLEYEKKKNWCSRISFMLDDMIEYMNGRFLNKKITLPKKVIISPKKNIMNKFDFLTQIVKLSREQETNKLIEFMKQNSMSSTLMDIMIELIKDGSEYEEHTKKHIATLLFLLHKTELGLSFDIISKAFSIASEDISDLKIDAPKAPENLAIIVAEIMKTSQDILQLTMTPSIGREYTKEYTKEDQIEMEKEQYKEWTNILHKASQLYPDILSKVNLCTNHLISCKH